MYLAMLVYILVFKYELVNYMPRAYVCTYLIRLSQYYLYIHIFIDIGIKLNRNELCLKKLRYQCCNIYISTKIEIDFELQLEWRLNIM